MQRLTDSSTKNLVNRALPLQGSKRRFQGSRVLNEDHDRRATDQAKKKSVFGLLPRRRRLRRCRLLLWIGWLQRVEKGRRWALKRAEQRRPMVSFLDPVVFLTYFYSSPTGYWKKWDSGETAQPWPPLLRSSEQSKHARETDGPPVPIQAREDGKNECDFQSAP